MRKCPSCGYEGSEKMCPSCQEVMENACEGCNEAESTCACGGEEMSEEEE